MSGWYVVPSSLFNMEPEHGLLEEEIPNLETIIYQDVPLEVRIKD